jgi:DNA-directed RNA polymerase specialized sigma subunit
MLNYKFIIKFASEEKLTDLVIQYKEKPNPDLFKKIYKHSKNYVEKHLAKIYSEKVDENYIEALKNKIIYDAIKNYDPSKGTKFETHLYNYIKKIYTEVETSGYGIEVSYNKIMKLRKVMDAYEELMDKKGGKEPTEEEIANHLNMKVDEVRELLALKEAREGVNTDFLLTAYQTPLKDVLYSHYSEEGKQEHLEVLNAIDKLQTTNPSLIAKHLNKEQEKVEQIVREIIKDANTYRNLMEVM